MASEYAKTKAAAFESERARSMWTRSREIHSGPSWLIPRLESLIDEAMAAQKRADLDAINAVPHSLSWRKATLKAVEATEVEQ